MRRVASLVPLVGALALVPIGAVGEHAVGGVSSTRNEHTARVDHARLLRPQFEMVILIAVKIDHAPPDDASEQDVRDHLVAELKSFLSVDTLKVKVDNADMTKLRAMCNRYDVTVSCDAITVTQLVDDAPQIIARLQHERVVAVKPVPPPRNLEPVRWLLPKGRHPDMYSWTSCRQELFENIAVWLRDYLEILRKRNQGVH